jgi:hypothetical protein
MQRSRWIVGWVSAFLVWCWSCQGALAGALGERIARFPDWHQPQLTQQTGELTYPDWFRGRWVATSTLREQVAPLAPDLMTPGFESNRQYLDRPIDFTVRFIPRNTQLPAKISPLTFPQLPTRSSDVKIVADRAFNGLNIAAAYLGKDNVKSVKIDPQKPTRQITQLTQDRQLVSFVTGFDRELPKPNKFIAAEVSQQVFKTPATIYLNTVETTTSYQLISAPTPKITATQISAIYLSPQDPDYFKARDLPVALYKYELVLVQNPDGRDMAG